MPALPASMPGAQAARPEPPVTRVLPSGASPELSPGLPAGRRAVARGLRDAVAALAPPAIRDRLDAMVLGNTLAEWADMVPRQIARVQGLPAPPGLRAR